MEKWQNNGNWHTAPNSFSKICLVVWFEKNEESPCSSCLYKLFAEKNVKNLKDTGIYFNFTKKKHVSVFCKKLGTSVLGGHLAPLSLSLVDRIFPLTAGFLQSTTRTTISIYIHSLPRDMTRSWHSTFRIAKLTWNFTNF